MSELNESSRPVIDDRETRLIYDNEKLKIKIDELNEIIESTDALNVQEMKTENTVLHQQVEQLQSQLQEKDCQMEILRADNNRFESIHSTLETVFSNLQVKENEMRELKTALRDKESEITRITQELEMNKQKLSEQETHTADESNFTNNEMKQLQLELHNTQESLQAKEQELGEMRKVCDKLTAQVGEQHNDEMENNATEKAISDLQETLTVKENKLEELQEERDALFAQHNELQTQHVNDEKTLNELKQQIASLQKEVEVKAGDTTTKALSLEQLLRNEGSTSNNATSKDNSIDLHSPIIEEYVQKCVNEAVASTERRLKEQTDMNAKLLSYKSLVQQENEAAEARAGKQDKTRNSYRNDKPLNSILSPKNNTAASNNNNNYLSNANSTTSAATATTMASDNTRASYDELRLKQEELQHSMQERVAAILAKSAVSKEDIQELLQQMLDYQETADEDSRTRLLIQSIQSDDKLEEYKKEMVRVKEENVSLSKVCKAQTREMEIMRKQYNELQEQLKETRLQQQQKQQGQQEQWDQHRHRQRDRHFDPESKELTPNANKRNNNDNNIENIETNANSGTPVHDATSTNLPTGNNIFQTNAQHPIRVTPPRHHREGSNADSAKLKQCPWCTFEQPMENVQCSICQRPLQPTAKR